MIFLVGGGAHPSTGSSAMRDRREALVHYVFVGAGVRHGATRWAKQAPVVENAPGQRETDGKRLQAGHWTSFSDKPRIQPAFCPPQPRRAGAQLHATALGSGDLRLPPLI
jgi:hypothetical protein